MRGSRRGKYLRFQFPHPNPLPRGEGIYASADVLEIDSPAWPAYSAGIAVPDVLMAALTFDTHKFIRKLEQAGFDTRQAEAVAEAFREASGEAEVTTRRDLREMELRLEARIADIKFDLVKWIAGMLLAQAGLVAALVKLL